MDESSPRRAQQIARAARDFERERTGRTPASVAVVLTGETLVVTLGGALPPAEQHLAHTPEGNALLREFHTTLFASGSALLRQEIERITGVEIRSASVEPQGGTGTIVLFFLLAASVPPETWSGTILAD